MQIDVKPRSTCRRIVASASSRSATESASGKRPRGAADELELVDVAPGVRERPAEPVESSSLGEPSGFQPWPYRTMRRRRRSCSVLEPNQSRTPLGRHGFGSSQTSSKR
jgi:hypothetical protein